MQVELVARVHRPPHCEPGCFHEVRDVVLAAGEALAAPSAPQLHDQLVCGDEHRVGAPEVVAQHVKRAVEVEGRWR